jgi:FtsZ-binding cell division protein ZapB
LKMEHNEDFARLEQFVEKLLDSHNQLKNENNEINALLQAKQQEITELQEMIKNLQEDRSVMHDRVTGLIGRIDEWEKNLDQEGAGQNRRSGTGAARDGSKKSSSLFNAAAEKSPETAVR